MTTLTPPAVPVARRLEAFVVLAAALAILLVAGSCGGDDGLTAKSLIPNLDDIGLEVAEEGRDPFADPSQDTYRARYVASDGTVTSAIVVLFVEPDVATAEVNYASLARLLENPPQEFFGADADQAEATTLDLGDERRAFVTAEADSQENRVWTDIYRKGQVIVVIQILSPESGDYDALRRAAAEAVLDKVE